MMQSDGFDDLDDVIDDDGNVNDEADPDDAGETETQAAPGNASTGTSDEPVLSDSQSDTPDEYTGVVDHDGEDSRGGAGSRVGEAVEKTPSVGLVKDLASRDIPGAPDGDSQYPFALRRGKWDDERGGNVKFVMRPETEAMEEAAAEEVLEELFPNTDMNKTDLREAAYIVGLQNLDDAVDVLNEWGFSEMEEMRK